MNLAALYLVFFKFGLLCFGGGYILIPLLQSELVEGRGVLAAQEFADLVSVAQVTPGPIGINTATYVGFTQHGVFGAVLATLGIVTPTLVLVLLAAKLLKRYHSSVPIQGFLRGMRPASLGLIFAAALIFAEMSVFRGAIPWLKPAEWLAFLRGVRIPALLIAAGTLAVLLKTKVSFLYLLLISAALGAFLCR
jgi:chromate transporter